ncbi:DUF5710 domain-containing protein [Aliidiomarina quisquiliarum]|uniref:DUF5710 domain-containing protein n=1 Tax=Aliidiomarina quisquiliarum TaxID=2938947 RepID=UPI00208F4FD7|nr:DUF5710 domain-containing protein [Aliidiomarina quisquiliarum]MCO4322301.1 DUF5710 domain-containing protein [Aliidiomarina quisquiliarum]
MNIYQMYVEHWRKPGFWVQRTTWGNTIAKITFVGELTGKPPYYGNPKVIATVYDIHTGEVKDQDFVIDTAGTYKTWRWVQPPKWSGESDFDPKKGRILLNIPFSENKKASSMGARWSEALGAWWIPEDDASLLEKANKRGYLTPPEARVHFNVGFENKEIAKQAGGVYHTDTKTWSFSETDLRDPHKLLPHIIHTLSDRPVSSTTELSTAKFALALADNIAYLY